MDQAALAGCLALEDGLRLIIQLPPVQVEGVEKAK